MILRNYDNVITALKLRTLASERAGSVISTDITTFGDGYLNVKCVSGEVGRIYSTAISPLCGFSSNEENDAATSNGYSNLVIGGSDTAVSYDDYCLGEQFTSSQVTAINNGKITESKVFDAVTNTFKTTYTRSYLANEDITIKEIGVKSGVNYTSSKTYTCLMYREVLDTPIEVPKNATVTLTFTIIESANPNKPADYVATASVE